MTAMTFAIGGISFWMPTYISEFRGQPDLGRVNMIFGAITVVAGLSATLLGGITADKLRKHASRALTSLFLRREHARGLPVLRGSALLCRSRWRGSSCSSLCSVFSSTPAHQTPSPPTSPARTSARSAFAITILSIHILGDSISPPIIGAITDATKSAGHTEGNMNTAFMVVGLAILLGGVIWLLGARHLDRDTAAASGTA